jgi:uncharacterized protein YjbJ (UPF0337 family)
MSFDDTTGRIKEAAGDLTGDKALQREGKLDQVQGAVKDAIEKFTDTANDAVEKVTDKAKSIVGKK